MDARADPAEPERMRCASGQRAANAASPVAMSGGMCAKWSGGVSGMVAGVGENGRLTIGVPRETVPGERRVALVPDIVKQLVGRLNVTVLVESGAGQAASFSDAAYEDAGATVVPDADALYAQADMIVKVQRPQFDPAAGIDEVALLRDGSILVAPLQPLSHPDLIRALADKRIVAFSMDSIPRITRAQSMDILSSQSTVSGYKAVLLAADNLPKFFPMLTTAAGSITPAKVLIIGAGVAGLQAIATARRLGAVVEAYDTRPVVKEQVESLGGRFVEVDVDTSDTQTAGGYAKEVSADVLRRQQEVLADRAARSDVVITTALVPGRPAPRLVSADTVGRMRHGSVIVDLAAETGGNCELTVPGEVVQREGVTIIGLLNLPSLVPVHASQMYAKNIQNLLALLVAKGQFAPDYADEIVAGTCITRDGDIVHVATRERLGLAAAAAG
jgi:proton-translocating NAD(P)+ transhydrogenase subunit alpha